MDGYLAVGDGVDLLHVGFEGMGLPEPLPVLPVVVDGAVVHQRKAPIVVEEGVGHLRGVVPRVVPGPRVVPAVGDPGGPFEGSDVRGVPHPRDGPRVLHHPQGAVVDDPEPGGVARVEGLLELQGPEEEGGDGPVPHVRS